MVGFPNNHGVFLLKMISTWGVKWGSPPPTSEVENFIMVFLPRVGPIFQVPTVELQGVFSNIWNHDLSRKFFISHLGKRESIDSNMPYQGGYVNYLEGIYLGFLRWFVFFSPGVFSIRNLPGCTKDGSWQICSIYMASVTRMCWMGLLTSFLCWCQAIQNSGWFHWMTYVWYF